MVYDGTCGFCARTVQFVLEHERARHDLRFTPLGGRLGGELRARHPELKDVDSVVWYERAVEGRAERVLVRYAAALEVAAYLGGAWALVSALGRVVPNAIGERVYDFVARHRHRIAGGKVCVLPSPEQGARFLDIDSKGS